MTKPRGTTWRNKSMLMRFLQATLAQIYTPSNLALTTPITLLPQPIVESVYNTRVANFIISFVKV
jgi:hypothetical protein